MIETFMYFVAGVTIISLALPFVVYMSVKLGTHAFYRVKSFHDKSYSIFKLGDCNEEKKTGRARKENRFG